MVVDALLELASIILSTFIDLIPEGVRAPGWVLGSVAALGSLFAAAATMGVWIPLDVAAAAALLTTNTYVAGAVVRGVRILISHFTGGGGSAA